MKRTGSCPKCQGTEVFRIATGANGTGHVAVFLGGFKAIKATRYICAACGFCEEYFEESERLRTAASKKITRWAP